MRPVWIKRKEGRKGHVKEMKCCVVTTRRASFREILYMKVRSALVEMAVRVLIVLIQQRAVCRQLVISKRILLGRKKCQV